MPSDCHVITLDHLELEILLLRLASHGPPSLSLVGFILLHYYLHVDVGVCKMFVAGRFHSSGLEVRRPLFRVSFLSII